MNSDSVQDNFTIDPVKGTLKPKYPVDFERLPSKSVGKLIGNMKSIGLFVEARDRGVPTLSSEVPVIIYIEDENDHAPRFEHTFYQASIPEDLAPGSTVLQVSYKNRLRSVIPTPEYCSRTPFLPARGRVAPKKKDISTAKATHFLGLGLEHWDVMSRIVQWCSQRSTGGTRAIPISNTFETSDHV